MKQGADWLSWSLQFIAGFVVGAVLALYAMRRSWPDHFMMITTGAGLIGAGVASYFGDRLWIGSSYRIIPPDEIQHSATSKALSFLTVAAGAGLIVVAVLWNVHVI